MTRPLLAVLAALFTVALATPATAGVFTISPTRVFLSTRATSALVTVNNQGTAPVRLQVTAHGWLQTPEGEMALSDTQEIVVFPSMLMLAPGEHRKIRIAVLGRVGDTERSFRVFLEELPPEQRAETAGAAVQMLTRMGVPVFVQPPKLQARAGIREVGLQAGALRFRVDNLGNTFFIPDAVRILGADDRGQVVLERSVDGWYILAGGTRRYELPIPSESCSALRSLTVEVRIGDVVLTERLQAASGACAAG